MGILNTLADLGKTAEERAKEKLERDFYEEFGKFICRFASAETAVHHLFRRVSGLKDNKARAIVGGESIKTMMEIITRISKMLPKQKFSKENHKELKILFDQISEISTFRHALVHSGADVDEGIIRTINYTKAKTRESIQEMTFGISDIRNASNDLSSIIVRIYHLVKADAWTRRNVPRMRREAWQYKSLKPSNWWGRILADELRRSRQPQSSPA